MYHTSIQRRGCVLMLTHVHPRYKKYYGKASGRLCRLFPSWNKTPTAEIFCAELMLGLQRVGPSRVDQSELLQRLDPSEGGVIGVQAFLKKLAWGLLPLPLFRTYFVCAPANKHMHVYIHVYTHVCMCTHTNAHINTHVKTC